MKKYILGLLMSVVGGCLFAQDSSLQKQANNPLANMISLNFQNYYSSKLSDSPSDAYINTTWVRLAVPFADGKLLLRASLPVSTFGVPSHSGNDLNSISGLSDANAFLSYNFVATPDKTIGVGPLVSMPTATNSSLGSEKWQGGLAFVAFFCKSPIFQYGGLVTWQKSFAGNKHRADASSLAVQPFAMIQLGKGYYMRSAPIWVFDLERGYYNVPISLGAGKVVKVNNVALNFFAEPQYSMLHRGVQSQVQFNLGVNIQFIK